MSESKRDLLTTTEAATRAGVHPRTLLRWLKEGVLPGSVTAGGHWRLSPAALDVFLAAHQSASGQPVRASRLVQNVLIVEDEPAHAQALARLVELLAPGCQVHYAKDALRGSLLLGVLLPDVAFVDIGLPELSGTDLIRCVREVASLSPVRFVVVTGYVSSERIEEIEQLGVGRDHVLAKPVTPAQIARILAELLPAKPARRTREETHA